MKYLVILVVVALLIVGGLIYFGSGDLSLAPKKTPPKDAAAPAPTPALDFTSLANQLQQDMAKIPTSLDAPRIAPTTAFGVRARLENGTVATLPAYQTIAKVCDLIIYADKEHSVRQGQDHQSGASVSGDPMANPATNQASASAARTAMHAKAQADWENYRQQTEAEVKRLLASLSAKS